MLNDMRQHCLRPGKLLLSWNDERALVIELLLDLECIRTSFARTRMLNVDEETGIARVFHHVTPRAKKGSRELVIHPEGNWNVYFGKNTGNCDCCFHRGDLHCSAWPANVTKCSAVRKIQRIETETNPKRALQQRLTLEKVRLLRAHRLAAPVIKIQ